MVLALPMSLARRSRLHLIQSAAKARLSRHAAVVQGLVRCQVRGVGTKVLGWGAILIALHWPVDFEDP
jgi:hypothetical protein